MFIFFFAFSFFVFNILHHCRNQYSATIICQLLLEDIHNADELFVRDAQFAEARSELDFAHLTNLVKEDKCYNEGKYNELLTAIKK